MKPSKTLTLAVFGASLAIGTAIADRYISPDDLSAQTAHPRGGFTTGAKVALHYGAGRILQSVNVSTITSPLTGVYCITPSAKLNMKKIYPQVTVDISATTGDADWVYWKDTTNSPINCTEKQIEVDTLQLVGGTVKGSSSIGFVLVVE